MSMWQFQNPEKVEEVLLDSLGTDYIIPGGSNDQTVFFHNGDKMTVDMKTGLMEWEPITPGALQPANSPCDFINGLRKGSLSQR